MDGLDRGDIMIEFLNVFVVPLISMSVYARRFKEPLAFDCVNFVRYGCLAVADFIAVFFAMKIFEFLIGIGGDPSSQFYTIIAVTVAFLVPYIYEVYKKYVNFSCEIKERRKEK